MFPVPYHGNVRGIVTLDTIAKINMNIGKHRVDGSTEIRAIRSRFVDFDPIHARWKPRHGVA